MTVETATTPAARASAPAPEVDDEHAIAAATPNDVSDAADEDEDSVETDGLTAAGEDGQTDASQAATPADESIEVEHEGKKYSLPKALQGALLMQADYTRKTQAVAQAAREVEAAREAFETERKTTLEAADAEADARGKVYAYQSQLKQWDAVDWDAIEAHDRANGTSELASALRRHAALKDALGTAQGELQGKISERTAKEQADAQRREGEDATSDAKLVREGIQHLTSKIPDWGVVAPKVVEFGQSRFGFSPQELAAVRDPRMFEVLHLAFLGAQSVDKAQTTQRVQRAQQVQPAPTTAGRSPPRPDKERMNTDEWMKQRNKEVQAGRKRP